MDLSIIVPVYNTELTVFDRCIKSLANLNISEYEVIVVDDGSDEYIEHYCREHFCMLDKFKFIKKENGGVSSARNMGIVSAKGRYIMFVDSDDILLDSAFSNADITTDADLIFFNKTLMKDDQQKERREVSVDTGYVDKKIIYREIIEKNRFHGPMARLYKRKVLTDNNIYYSVKMIQGEDLLFNLDFLKACQSIYYNNKSIYGYFFTPITLKKRWKKDPNRMLENLIRVFHEKKSLIVNFEKEEIKPLERFLYSNAEYGLFQSMLDMIDVNVLNLDRKERCLKFSGELTGTYNLTPKAYIGSVFINYKLWRLMIIVALFRKIYICKIKKSWD